MNRPLVSLLLVAAFAGVVLLTNLGGPRLWDRDEPRNASCAAEMLARGDWVTPVMNGELRTHKPIMLYWVTMAFYSIGGVSEFTARLGSALSGVGTVLLTYAIGRRLFSPTAALWGALALATMLMFNVASRAATPDGLLIFFITATLAAFVYAHDWRADSDSSPSQKLSYPMAALVYLAASGAILTKGPVGVLLPLAAVGAYLMALGYQVPARTERTWKSLLAVGGSLLWQTPKRFWIALWRLRPLLGAAILLAVAAPWYIWVGIRTQGYWTNGFFFEHNLQRFNDSMEGHSGSILYYPVALLIGSFPWSVLLIPIGLQLRQGKLAADRRPLLFCACWIGVIVGLFSLAQTKLPSYITPCYPAVALIVGWFFARVEKDVAVAPIRWLQASGAVLLVAGVALLIALPIVASLFAPRDLWLGVLGLAPLLGGVGLIYAARKRPDWAPPALACSAAATMLGLFAVAADRVDSYRRHEELLTAIEASDSSRPIAAWNVLEPSWVFYSGRTLEVVESAPLSRRVVQEKDAPTWRQETVETPEAFLRRCPEGVLVTARSIWEKEKEKWSDQLIEVAHAPYFLKKDELVALQARAVVAKKQKSETRR